MSVRNGLKCLFDKLTSRGLVSKIYPESQQYQEQVKTLLNQPTCIYAGFDATSDSLHVGNLATLMSMVHFHSYGHRVICLIGDATTLVGDPSGHTADRLKIPKETIANNSEAIEEIIKRVFQNYGEVFAQSTAPVSREKLQPPVIVRNSQWYKGRDVVEFVGEVFREVRVGGLLHKKSISERLSSSTGMNMSEFSYQIFQAYDWLQLRNLYDCRLQLGGSDQAGNIYTGHDLIKKLTGARDAIGLLAPLITDNAGKKLGKSTNKITSQTWLRSQKTNPFQLYQFFHNTPDSQVEKLLKIYSFYDEPEIQEMVTRHLKDSQDVWYCQRKLAEHVCQLVHGEAGLESARHETRAIYHRNPPKD